MMLTCLLCKSEFPRSTLGVKNMETHSITRCKVPANIILANFVLPLVAVAIFTAYNTVYYHQLVTTAVPATLV